MMKLKIDLFKGGKSPNLAKKPQKIKKLPLNLRMLPLKRLAIIKRFDQGFKSSLLWSATVTSLSVASIISSFVATPALAAEKLILRLGPFQQSVNVADLDRFAKTGQLSTSLRPYGALLTPQVQQLLTKRLQVDPNLANKFIDDLLRAPEGNQLIKQIRVAIPDSTVTQVRIALALALRQANGLSAISFLRAYPDEQITVDLSSAIAIALEINVPFIQSQSVTSLLESSLTVPNTSFSASFNPANPGSQRITKRTITLQDTKRNRAIPVDIYWEQSSSGRLVVISHGFAANRESLAYLARHLASQGLTVAALDHPDSNFTTLPGASIGGKLTTGGVTGLLLPASEFIDRPKDISFLLDQLAELNQQPGTLQGKLNTQQVSVIGHSLGGYTALAVAGGELNLDQLRSFCQERSLFSKSGGDWLQCAAADLPQSRLQLQDKRVAQAIALNPVIGQLFGKTGLAQVNIPTLIWTSTGDALTPTLSHQLRPFSQLGGSKYLVTAIGGTHLSVSDPDNINPQLAQTTLVREITGKEAEPMRQLLKGVSLAFIKQLTPEANNYEQFLTSGYAQSLSTPGLSLRLNTTLPANLNAFVEFAQ